MDNHRQCKEKQTNTRGLIIPGLIQDYIQNAHFANCSGGRGGGGGTCALILPRSFEPSIPTIKNLIHHWLLAMDKPRLGIRNNQIVMRLEKKTFLKLIYMLIAYISPKIKDIGRQALNLKVSICRENSSKRKRVLRKSGCGPDTIKFGI